MIGFFILDIYNKVKLNMRAKTVNYKTAYIFDFDDTLVKTKARIKVIKNNKIIKSLDSIDYKNYKLKRGETLNFDEFDDPTFILQSKKYKMWPVLVNIYKNNIWNNSNEDIYILTARTNKSKYTISSFLNRNNIDLPLSHIFTIGGDKDIINKNEIPKLKKKVLQDLSKEYDKIIFYDDNEETIENIRNLPKVHITLVD